MEGGLFSPHKLKYSDFHIYETETRETRAWRVDRQAETSKQTGRTVYRRGDGRGDGQKDRERVTRL